VFVGRPTKQGKLWRNDWGKGCWPVTVNCSMMKVVGIPGGGYPGMGKRQAMLTKIEDSVGRHVQFWNRGSSSRCRSPRGVFQNQGQITAFNRIRGE
jgi:hypothetical protein